MYHAATLERLVVSLFNMNDAANDDTNIPNLLPGHMKNACNLLNFMAQRYDTSNNRSNLWQMAGSLQNNLMHKD
jgi:hypothetical protein